MFTIRLPDEIESRLTALARKTRRTKAFHIRKAILEYLEGLEDLHLAEEQRLTDIRAGKSRTIPPEDVMKRYGK